MDSRTEIDQIVKEAQEGVDTFGTLWYQVFDVDKAKKLKNAFRKQHSTLRRNRAKIDKLLMSTEFEDVEALLYSRELLDREMGRYKVIEEEIKTKVEPDPRETAVSETRNLIKTLVGEFTLEIGKFKAEMTTEGKTGKRPRSTYLEDTIASFESEVEKLSSLSQLDELSLQEVQGVKDLVKQRQKYLYDVINFLPSFPRRRVRVINEYIRGYKVLKELGDGDYGTVFEVMEPTTSKIFALKVIPLENGQIKNTMAREISILYSMEENKVENIIRLKNAFFYKESICLVMELMPRTLAAILESRNVKISRNLVQKWVKQLIDGVAYLHDKEIIHRDINPKNILVDDDFNLKLADFGFARHLYKKAALTPEVWNAKYNAPEVLLGASNYGKPSDMWSIGCVFAAILLNPNLPFDITGRHVDAMYSGNNDKGYRYSILDAIFSELGTPQEELWKGWTKLPHYPHCGFPSYPVKAYNVPHGFDEEGGHMLQALLKVTPDERLTIEDAKRHPYYLSGPKYAPE